MPVFDYEARDGQRVERIYGVGRAPRTVRVAGKRFHRVIVAAPRLSTAGFRPHTYRFSQADVPVLERMGIRTKDGEALIRTKHDTQNLKEASDGRFRHDPEFYAAEYDRDVRESGTRPIAEG